MKIYTKTGDKGTTLLANGSRVSKSSLRIDSYGMVDELNAHMGHLLDILLVDTSPPPLIQEISYRLSHLREVLFTLGAELALAPLESNDNTCAEETRRLERDIDKFWEVLPPLKNFVLPGGHLANSQAHICRCVCRRSERAICLLAEQEEIRKDLIIFFNRLSDWLFAACRTIHKAYDIEEILWQSRK